MNNCVNYIFEKFFAICSFLQYILYLNYYYVLWEEDQTKIPVVEVIFVSWALQVGYTKDNMNTKFEDKKKLGQYVWQIELLSL